VVVIVRHIKDFPYGIRLAQLRFATTTFQGADHEGNHFRGGVNYWFKERVGLRIEVRDHVVIPSDGFNLIGVRFGIAFR